MGKAELRRWRIKLDDDTEQVKRAALSYDLSDQALKVGAQQFDVAKGNRFYDFLDEDWNLARSVQLSESMRERAS